MRKAINIMWDYDEDEFGGTAQWLGLPDHVEIPDDVDDEDVADWLSDEYEFCVFSFDIVKEMQDMKDKYVVVKTHNFDPETEATEFTDYRKATAYLNWMWESYYNEEIDCGSDLNEEECWHEANLARVTWSDGDYTEFNLIEVHKEREDFPSDWERYVTE